MEAAVAPAVGMIELITEPDSGPCAEERAARARMAVDVKNFIVAMGWHPNICAGLVNECKGTPCGRCLLFCMLEYGYTRWLSCLGRVARFTVVVRQTLRVRC